MSSSGSVNKPALILKLIMVGDSGVGKSAILKAFMGDGFSSDYVSTIGVDFELKQVIIDNEPANLQIWDTAGQDRFRSITSSYYRSADAVLMCFDLTNRESFKNLRKWLRDIEQYARDVDIVLVGNKCDAKGKRKVSRDEAETFAKSFKMSYLESSARDYINIDEAFTTLTIQAVQSKRKKMQARAGQRNQQSSSQRSGRTIPGNKMGGTSSRRQTGGSGGSGKCC